MRSALPSSFARQKAMKNICLTARASEGGMAMLRVTRATIAAYLIPMFVAIALVNLWPIFYTFTISFTNKSLFHLDDYHFVGLDNYQQAIGSLQGEFFYVLLQ